MSRKKNNSDSSKRVRWSTREKKGRKIKRQKYPRISTNRVFDELNRPLSGQTYQRALHGAIY